MRELLCLNDARSQGGLTVGNKYTVIKADTATSRVCLRNNSGNTKWYTMDRFAEVVNKTGESDNVEKQTGGILDLTATPKVVVPKRPTTIREYLEGQKIPMELTVKIADWHTSSDLSDEMKARVAKPNTLYTGEDTLKLAIAALLAGKNILLEGVKATGKNILADTLSMIFGRPKFDVSFHIGIDDTALIGAETFKNGEVTLRDGAVTECAKVGGFLVLDEINMARNENIALLHAVLDDRREVSVAGYASVKLHPNTRIIATMNHGYSGTRELNEALMSRFVVIRVAPLDKKGLRELLNKKFPNITADANSRIGEVFNTLQSKAVSGEITPRAVDLRGILDGLGLISMGITPRQAFASTLTNKVFDQEEGKIVQDVLDLHFTSTTKVSEVLV